MVEVQLEPELEARLACLAAETSVTKSFFVHEDSLAGIRSLSAATHTISQEEMEQRSSVTD